MARKKELKRKTKETDINISLNIDGEGNCDIKTGLPFFNHMLENLAKHALFDLDVKVVKGDIEVDAHHTVEDVGLGLGEVLNKALGDKKSIKRYGKSILPMDEALSMVAVDLSDRPYLVFDVDIPTLNDYIPEEFVKFNPQLVKEFFQAFVNKAGINLHIKLIYGDNLHHIIESVFKGVAKALEEACQINKRQEGVPSTKGKL